MVAVSVCKMVVEGGSGGDLGWVWVTSRFSVVTERLS